MMLKIYTTNLNKIKICDEKLQICKSMTLKDRPGLQLQPSKTGQGRRWQRIEQTKKFDKFDPHTIHLADISYEDVDLVLIELKQQLGQITGARPRALDISVRHYYRNFLVPVIINKQLYDKGRIPADQYKEFLNKKQIEFEVLTEELAEAIKNKRLEKYPTSQRMYEIGKSYEREVKSLLLDLVRTYGN